MILSKRMAESGKGRRIKPGKADGQGIKKEERVPLVEAGR